MIIHHTTNGKHPIDTLEHARSKTRNDWVADAILVEAQLAFKYGYTGARVAKFAQSLIKAFGYGNQT